MKIVSHFVWPLDTKSFSGDLTPTWGGGGVQCFYRYSAVYLCTRASRNGLFALVFDSVKTAQMHRCSDCNLSLTCDGRQHRDKLQGTKATAILHDKHICHCFPVIV